LNNSKFKVFSVDSFGITWTFYLAPTSLPSEAKHNGEKNGYSGQKQSDFQPTGHEKKWPKTNFHQ